MVGFDPLVNQRLLPPSFPRQAELLQRDKVLVTELSFFYITVSQAVT